MEKTDSYKFISGITKRMVKKWISIEEQRDIPFERLKKPLRKCRVALLTSGGIAMKSDLPFDQDGERSNPWWGDPSHRVIPSTATTADIKVYHLHIDPILAQSDINCLLPIDRLKELELSNEIGSVADSHYSYMGYILQPDELLNVTVPKIIRNLRAESVDVVILVPA